MKRFVDGVDRSQGLLLPDRLEDYVHEDNPVRVAQFWMEIPAQFCVEINSPDVTEF